MTTLNYVRRRLSQEDGFSILEVLVAAIILVLGSMAVFMALASAIHGVQRSKEVQQGVSVAQREMERIRSESFAGIGNSSTMSRTETVASSPISRLNAGGSEFNVNRTGTTKYLPLVTNGTLTAKTEGVRSSDGTEMTVYRFVVCEEGIASSCNQKRIIVAVQTIPQKNQASYRHSYYELQSTVTKTGA